MKKVMRTPRLREAAFHNTTPSLHLVGHSQHSGSLLSSTVIVVLGREILTLITKVDGRLRISSKFLVFSFTWHTLSWTMLQS